MSVSAPPALHFRVFRGETLLREFSISAPAVTIGRGEDATLCIDDASISELHAVVNVQAHGSVVVFDAGSDAGTRVGGARVSNAPLCDGDAFEIGDLRVVVGFAEQVATSVSSLKSGAFDRTEDVPRGADSWVDAPVSVLSSSAVSAAVSISSAAHAALREERMHSENGAVGGGSDPINAADPSDVVNDIETIITRPSPPDPRLKGRTLQVHQVWGDQLFSSRSFDQGAVTVGPDCAYTWASTLVKDPAGSSFFLPSVPVGTSYVLVQSKGNSWVVRVAPGWDGYVESGNVRYTFEMATSSGLASAGVTGIEIPVVEGARVVVEAEGRKFFIQLVARPLPLSFMDSFVRELKDSMVSPSFVLSAFALFLMLIMGILVARTPYVPRNEMTELDQRYVELLLEKPPEPEVKKKSANPDAGEGAKAKDEEGKVGKKDAKIEKAKGDKVKLQKQEIDRQVVERAGIMGALNDDTLSQTLGASGLSSDIQGGIGGLIGAKGTQIGSGGLGSRGSGIGGGGTAEGLGGLGTKGIGSGASGYGSGGGDFGKKGDGGIGTVGGDPIILGALDRSLIDEVIKRHMNQIRYCYQRELVKNNSLGGKIVIKFTIAKDGSVSQAGTKTTSMNNQAVESCIEGRFYKMQFPQPKGGGIVVVSYPFLFSPG